MSCWCYGACFRGGCSAFPEGRRNPEDPWGPLLPPSNEPPPPEPPAGDHGNGLTYYEDKTNG